VLAPCLMRRKRKGKVRHIGVTEAAIIDHTTKCSNARCAIRSGRYSWWPST
jgi:hypothetical protein